jgi:hypothetical protein
MTFPNAHSTVYRNEEGEVLGWSDETSYEPEYCDICGFNHSGDCMVDDYYEEELDDDDPATPAGS